MRSSFIALTLVGSSLAIFAACGGGTPAATAPTTTPSASASAVESAAPVASASAAPAEVVAPAAPWSDAWSLDQKVAFMKAAVMPKLGPIFQAVDAKKYADFGCKTCHGPDKKEPKAFLPHLTFKNGKLTCFAEKPEVSKFMMEKVSPAMADALGEPHYDPKTQKGFGCGGCHTIDMVK
jgi:hypothetical protein